MQIGSLPPMPKEWSSSPGWTVYEKNIKDQNIQRQVPFPKENLLFFDVEVCMTDGKLPTMAVALSPNKWFFKLIFFVFSDIQKKFWIFYLL